MKGVLITELTARQIDIADWLFLNLSVLRRCRQMVYGLVEARKT